MSKKIFKSLVLFSLPMIFLASSCNKIDEKGNEAAEQKNIDNFLSSNPTLFFDQKESGLYYMSVVSGSGDVIGAHDTALIRYTGKFLNGYVFDTTAGTDTFEVVMGTETLIPGLEEAISYMREGGKSICLIPSKLAYGRAGYPPYIPGYTPLIFELYLPRIGKAPQK